MELFTILATVLPILGGVGALVWKGSDIISTLSNNLEHLSQAVNRLTIVVNKMDTRVDEHGEKLAVHEQRLGELEKI